MPGERDHERANRGAAMMMSGISDAPLPGSGTVTPSLVATEPLVSLQAAPPIVRWIEMFDGRPAHGQRVLVATDDGRVFIGHRGDIGAYLDDHERCIEGVIRWWALIPMAPQIGGSR